MRLINIVSAALVLLASQGATAGSVECLAAIIHSESSGEPLEGLIAVAQASINRAKATHREICSIRGVTRKTPPQKIARYYLAIAKSALDGGESIVGRADSWERALRPRYAGLITRRIGKHTFYTMKGLR